MEDRIMLVEYVRKGGIKKFRKTRDAKGKLVPKKRSQNKGGNRIGILVAVPADDRVLIGWSLCNVKAGDVFDHDFGLSIATDRATKGSSAEIAASLAKKAHHFVHRVRNYYKDKEVEVNFQWPADRVGGPAGLGVNVDDPGQDGC